MDDFPSTPATVDVAALLVLAALVVGVAAVLWSLPAPQWLVRAATWAVCVMLLLRGAGRFVVSGMNQVTAAETSLSIRDTLVYSPLTLLLGVPTSRALVWTVPNGVC